MAMRPHSGRAPPRPPEFSEPLRHPAAPLPRAAPRSTDVTALAELQLTTVSLSDARWRQQPPHAEGRTWSDASSDAGSDTASSSEAESLAWLSTSSVADVAARLRQKQARSQPAHQQVPLPPSPRYWAQKPQPNVLSQVEHLINDIADLRVSCADTSMGNDLLSSEPDTDPLAEEPQ